MCVEFMLMSQPEERPTTRGGEVAPNESSKGVILQMGERNGVADSCREGGGNRVMVEMKVSYRRIQCSRAEAGGESSQFRRSGGRETRLEVQTKVVHREDFGNRSVLAAGVGKKGRKAIR